MKEKSDMAFDLRSQDLFNWLTNNTTLPIENFQLITGDASFRRYFRFTCKNQTFIAVDAPPETEDNPTFVNFANMLRDIKINVPDVLHHNYQKGFLWLSDLGSVHLANIITPENYQQKYTACLNEISKFKNIAKTESEHLPKYTQELVHFELSIFTDWLVKIHLNIELNTEEQALIESTFNTLNDNFFIQPSTFVHRDFHSRNIMFMRNKKQADEIALIDFQGGLIGPVTYDVVSLLKDCYIKWPDTEVAKLAEQHRQQYYPEITPKQWQRYFDLTGMQRHLKAAGIFARLKHRDNKGLYLADIPRTLDYVYSAGLHYAELAPFSHWLKKAVIDKLD